MALLGQVAGEHWNGPLLAQSYKYRINDGLDEWTAEDRPDKGRSLIPVALDPTRLAPFFPFMDWRATAVDDYDLDTDASKATPRKASPETPPRNKASPKNKERKLVNTAPLKDEYNIRSNSADKIASGSGRRCKPRTGQVDTDSQFSSSCTESRRTSLGSQGQ